MSADEKVDLEDNKWEDIHVTTGALKMFFREFPEPLFTYASFNDFVEAISEFFISLFVWLIDTQTNVTVSFPRIKCCFKCLNIFKLRNVMMSNKDEASITLVTWQIT